MKVNFSIDFILGECGKKNKTSSSMKHATVKNHTVEWITNEYGPDHQTERKNNSFSTSFDDNSKILNVGLPAVLYEPSACYCNLYNETQPSLIPCHQNGSCFNCTSMKQLFQFVTEAPVKFDHANKQRQPSKKKYSLDKEKRKLKLSENNNVQVSDMEYTKAITVKEREKTDQRTKSNRIGRRLFKGNQILELEKAFALNSYLTRAERAALAEKINLTECQIKTWFQNRRTKQKRRGTDCDDIDNVIDKDDVLSEKSYQPRSIHVPGHGVQARSTYGPPDKYLKAAIVDYLKRYSIKNKKE